MDYKNKFILAPMVRVGFLPLRLLCLEYGCDIVYCEEIIDHKMLQSKRVVNPVLGTVDYMAPGEQYPIFQTCSQEKGKVVFQMGGMGAALLTRPEKIEAILTTLVKGVSKPITCKIRVLPKLEDTINLVKLIERCGVAAIAVHGRTKDERPPHPNRNDVIKQIAASVSIPVIANGGSKEITCYDNITKFRHETGASSVMLARCALLNPSIFRSAGLLNIHAVIEKYLRIACQYDSNQAMVKYTLQLFLQDALQNTERGRQLLETSTLNEFCTIWGLSDYYVKQKAKQRDRFMRHKHVAAENFDDDSNESFFKNAISLNIPFVRKHFDRFLPKNILLEYCKSKNLTEPIFKTLEIEKRFVSIVEIDGKKFYSNFREKNKKYAEQAASFVAVLAMNLEKSLPISSLTDLPFDEIKLKLDKTLFVV